MENMKAPKSEWVSQVGVSLVKAEFQSLGWAVVEDLGHDLGIDLYVRPRNESGYEYGVIMGVQVKTGQSYFAEVYREEGRGVGWWYRENDMKHFNYWLKNAFQTLVVLVDESARICYWAHVNEDTVEIAGKGAKIGIRDSFQIGEGSREAITSIALLQRKYIGWYGSPTMIVGKIAEDDVLRTCLVAPKVTAMKNVDSDSRVTGMQALSSMILMDDRILRAFNSANGRGPDIFQSRNIEIPDRVAVENDGDWPWVACYAMYDWLAEGDDTAIRLLDQYAETNSERVASLVVKLAVERFGTRSLSVPDQLTELLNRGNLNEIDRAWLSVHQAALLQENGYTREAFELAMKVQSVGRSFQEDVTAQSISAVASLIALNTFGLISPAPGDLLGQVDNAAFWWRNGQVELGLEFHLNQSYKNELQRGVETIGGYDAASVRFYSASLISAFMADVQGWRRAQSLLGKHKTVSHYFTVDSRDYLGLLLELWNSGDSSSLELILRRLPEMGKAAVVVKFFRDIDLERYSARNLLCTIRAASAVADYLPSCVANDAAEWLVGLVLDPTEEQLRQSSRFDRLHYCLKSLGALLPSIPYEGQVDLITRVVDGRPWKDPEELHYLIPLLEGASNELLIGPFKSRLEDWCRSGDQTLSYYCCRVLAGRSDIVVERVLSDIAAGQIWALQGLNSIRDVPSGERGAIWSGLSSHADSIIEDAQCGTFSHGPFAVFDWIVGFALEFGDAEYWEKVLEFLSSGEVAWRDHVGGIRQLLHGFDRIPLDCRQRVAAALLGLRNSTSPFSRWMGPRDENLLDFAANVVNDNVLDAHLLVLLSRGGDSRRLASTLLYRLRFDDYLWVVYSLVGDSDLVIRANALSVVLANLENLPECSVFLSVVEEALREDNPVVVKGFVGAFSQLDDLRSWSSLIELASKSCSARVRRHVSQLKSA
ncbi:DUF4365 domain-containing protein [Corynebacterium xerosis]|uniref:DUF4365 domain-containing protein n=1 Tax=Corynebacterium xerosis TaxID=1725 RepID=UPI000EAF4637|nr:DUF4365 domain-containing protein [Corynebacterium xerosis]AYJ32744.1 DUF4365 domain-containing protein [Corynebacterium xerosis]